MKDVRDLWMAIKNPAQLADALERVRLEERERCAKIADDRTPPKHTTPLAAHVKAVEIAQAIRNGDNGHENSGTD